jgi:hypothetical protein
MRVKSEKKKWEMMQKERDEKEVIDEVIRGLRKRHSKRKKMVECDGNHMEELVKMKVELDALKAKVLELEQECKLMKLRGDGSKLGNEEGYSRLDDEEVVMAGDESFGVLGNTPWKKVPKYQIGKCVKDLALFGPWRRPVPTNVSAEQQ